MKHKFEIGATIICMLMSSLLVAQERDYPRGYFRNPLNIPLELVANFGELRNNHWHMGLDIRTQQRENLPVHAAAEGFVARVKIEPGGFGRAIYIQHPNGFTTLYAHLNAFMPALEKWVKEQQYLQESWAVELVLPPGLFSLTKGQFFAFSGNTGGSAGPHVHFEIRDTETNNCLNPLLFGFPIKDGVPPTLARLGVYDRNKSTYAQSPRVIALKKTGAAYAPVTGGTLMVTSDRVSLSLGATDRFTGSGNSNGIYSARVLLDNELQSEFVLDNINYDATRYMNAHTDYRHKYNGGPWLQHLSPLPADKSSIYAATETQGILQLSAGVVHTVRLEVRDAAQNLSRVEFNLVYNPVELIQPAPLPVAQLIPNWVNVFEETDFEVFTTEETAYDTINITYKKTLAPLANPRLVAHSFISASIPAHDSITVRIKPELPDDVKQNAVIVGTAGTRKVVAKGRWNGEWISAKFRQFGVFQVVIDTIPPGINAPPQNLTRSNQIIFTPRDNLGAITSFSAELDGRWLRFTNNGGRSWVYRFDEHFLRGAHELRVTVEDVAGNQTSKTWQVIR